MADFNYQRDHSRAFYNPKGQPFWCHSKEDELRAKEQGFKSAAYIPSQWPKTAFHTKTGQTRMVGKLEWTKEQNADAVAALGSEWTLEHVAVPEPAVETASAQQSGFDLNAVATILAEIKLLGKRLEENEVAVASLAETVSALQQPAAKTDDSKKDKK